MPNMYARGILFGKMVLELGDTCIAKNEKHGLYCDLEFKTKVIEMNFTIMFTKYGVGIFLWHLQRYFRQGSQEHNRNWRDFWSLESHHGF